MTTEATNSAAHFPVGEHSGGGQVVAVHSQQGLDGPVPKAGLARSKLVSLQLPDSSAPSSSAIGSWSRASSRCAGAGGISGPEALSELSARAMVGEDEELGRERERVRERGETSNLSEGICGPCSRRPSASTGHRCSGLESSEATSGSAGSSRGIGPPLTGRGGGGPLGRRSSGAGGPLAC